MNIIKDVLYDERGCVVYFEMNGTGEEIVMDFSMKDVLPNVVSNDKCKKEGVLWEGKIKEKKRFEVELNSNIPAKNRVMRGGNKKYDMFLTVLYNSNNVSDIQRSKCRIDKPVMLDILNESIKHFKLMKKHSHMVAILKIIKNYLIAHFENITLYKLIKDSNNNLSERNSSYDNTVIISNSYRSKNSSLLSKQSRNDIPIYKRLFRNHFLNKTNSNYSNEIPLSFTSQQKSNISVSIISKEPPINETNKSDIAYSYIGNSPNNNKTNVTNGLTTTNNNNISNTINNTCIGARSNSTISIHKIKPKVITLCKNNFFFYKPRSLNFSSNNKKEFTLDEEENDANNNNANPTMKMMKSKSLIDVKQRNEKKMLCGFVDDNHIQNICAKKEFVDYRKQLKAKKGLQFYINDMKRNELLNPAFYMKIREREMKYDKYIQKEKMKALCKVKGTKFYYVNVEEKQNVSTSNSNIKHN